MEEFEVDFGLEDNEEDNEIDIDEEHVYVKDFNHWKQITRQFLGPKIIIQQDRAERHDFKHDFC